MHSPKDILSSFGLLATALSLLACSAPNSANSGDATPTNAIELGVRWYSGAAITKNEVLTDSSEFLNRVSSDEYAGEALVNVTRDYDITDVDEDAPEQILTLKTSSDHETWSTHEGLRSAGGVRTGDNGSGDYESTSVMFVFDAVIGDEPTPDNGILELESDTQSISVTWEYPSNGDEEKRNIELTHP